MIVLSLFLKASCLFGLAVLLHVAFAHRASAATRHLLWTLALVGALFLPIVSVALPEWAVDIAGISPAHTLPVQTAIEGLTLQQQETPFALPARANNSAPRLPRWPIVLSILYIVGVVLLFGRLIGQHLWTWRIVGRAMPLHDGHWLALLDSCASTLGVRRNVQLRRVAGDAMPMAAGVRRAVILIPAAADSWPDDRRRAVLLHELAHIDRHDCLTQTLAAMACAMYWIHPGVWWIAKRLRTERELACDDCVLTAGAEGRDYARHLLELAYTLGAAAAPAVAVTMARRGELEGRLLAALDPARNRAIPPRASRLAAFAVLCIVTVPVAAATIGPSPHVLDRDELRRATAQRGAGLRTAVAQVRPTFDVAAIRATPPDTGPGTDFSARPGGRLHVRNDDLSNLIANAYGVEGYLLVGGPEWVRSDRYDLEAKTGGEPDRAEMMLMLQALLAERFQLRVHYETRELSAYVLTVARSGMKLTPTKDGDCLTPRSDGAPGPSLAPGERPRPGCGNNNMNNRTHPPNMTWTAVGIDSMGVAVALANYFRRPVVDRTGLTGFFNIRLDLPPLPRAARVGAHREFGPSVFTVLQEQLGLKVTEGQGPVDVLVIDHVARPAPTLAARSR